MLHKLEIRTFFFNAKTDYLPYYKHFNITLEDDATAKDLLLAIQTKNENFSFSKQQLVFKINDLVVNARHTIEEIVAKCGTSLQIDPVTSYRSNNGLIINDNDFMQSFALLEPYASEADLDYYKTLYALHYASETSNYEREYIGDAILVLAHKMINEGSEYKEEILKAISSVQSGLFDCEYENNLFDPEDHTPAIEALKAMLKPKASPSLLEIVYARFKKNNPSAHKIAKPQSINGKNVAYYTGGHNENREMMLEAISNTDANYISFARSNKRSGLSIIEENPALAYIKAGSILLDALDSGADILIVENKVDCEMFQKEFKKIEKAMGREIYLEFILASDLLASLEKTAA